MDDGRPDPDALLAAAQREGRGRLKIFLGAAPGVGKTWRMLVEARRLADEGLDVLAGVIETHGRAETEAQIGTLAVLPRHRLEYRGQALAEFDLDAALARRPALLLIDELAHTNAPGSRHAKRWEDVVELVEAGLTVWATLNVQHLESLNDDVARITGVRVSETLPDHVLAAADEVELIDISPADLRARLREGRVYKADTAQRALDGYFKAGNLAALREIALRRTAERVDFDVRDWMRENRVAGPWPAGDRVLALIGPDAAGESVIRYAKQVADALHAPWIALHVERPSAAPAGRPSLRLAEQLGAEVETRSGSDLVGVALELAGARNVTQIVVGRAPPSRWRRWPRRTLGGQLLRRATSYALHVVPSAPPRATQAARPDPRGWVSWAAATLLVGAVTGLGLLVQAVLPPDAMGMVFLTTVVAAATLQGVRLALYTAAAAFLAWDFFFLPPLHTIAIANAHDAVALAVFLAVAAVTGTMAGRLRGQAQAGQARIESLRRITGFSRRLGEPANEPDLLAEIVRQAAEIAGQASLLVASGEDLPLRAVHPETVVLDDASMAAARWCATHGTETGSGTATLPSATWRFLPMRTVRGVAGVLGVRAASERKSGLDAAALQAIETLADQAAVALERVRLAGQAARGAAMQETQKLRGDLLASLGADLDAPLAGIAEATAALRAGPPASEDKAALLTRIETALARMTRFLADIAELTRIESGQVAPRLAAVRVAEAIEAAIARVPEASHVAVALPDAPPSVLADPELLEQALASVLENAVAHSPAWSPIAIRVTIAARRVHIAVADEGAGIAPPDLPYVFDSFRRQGAGLDLAMARGLVEAIGGSIDAVSPRPDAPRDGAPGTVVTIRLAAG